MTYERGKNKALDDAVDAMRVHFPGFYPGCTMEIVDAPHYHTKYIGKQFKATTSAATISDIAEEFKTALTGVWYIDPGNTYGINYRKNQLKVVDPIYWDAVSVKDPYGMTMDELVAEMQTYYPGFYIGCTMEIIKKPYTSSACRIGDTFITANVSHEKLADTVKNLRKDDIFILDPANTYFANYTKDCLKVQESVKPESPNSLGFRIKTIDEMIHQYGRLDDVPGTFNASRMPHLSGLSIVDAFASEILSRGIVYSRRNNFVGLNPADARDYNWYITTEMITNAPLSASALGAQVHMDISGSMGDDQVSVPAESSKEPLMISEFTTIQLSSKKKRPELSLN